MSVRPIHAALAAGALLAAGMSAGVPAADTPPSMTGQAPHTVDDATLAREYDAYVQSLRGLKWYRVQFIRLADEAEARQEIARLRSGADFAAEARQKSTHAESAAHGGALGTHAGCEFGRDTVALLDALSPGQIHPQPVRASNGWGIYRLESVEPVVPRSFGQYRAQILDGTFRPECPWRAPVQVQGAPAR